MRNKNELFAVDVETGEPLQVENESTTTLKKRSQTKDMKDKLFNVILFGENVQQVSRNHLYHQSFTIPVESYEIIHKFSNGTLKDAIYLSQLLFALKKYSYHDDIILISLVMMSSSYNQDIKRLFRVIFPKIITTPELLQRFYVIVKTKMFRGFAKVICRATEDVLNNFQIQEFVKSVYSRREIDNNSNPINSFLLSDIIKLAHPKPHDSEQSDLYKWTTMHGRTSTNNPLLLSVKAFERASTKQERDNILKNNYIPLSLALSRTVSFRSLLDASELFSFDDIYKNIGQLKNIDAFNDSHFANHFYNLFSNENIIKNSCISPIDYALLYDVLGESHPKVLKGIEAAIEHSYSNMPEITKPILIVLDVSKAMNKIIHYNDIQISAKIVSSTLAAILYKKAINATVVVFSNSIIDIKMKKDKSTISIADSFATNYSDGDSPNYKELFSYINELDFKPEGIVWLSGTEPWIAGIMQDEVIPLYQDYLNVKLNESLPTQYFINIGKTSMPNTHSLPNTYFVSPWNNNVWQHMMQTLGDYSSIKNSIDKIEI